jgi:hypothetical protein
MGLKMQVLAMRIASRSVALWIPFSAARLAMVFGAVFAATTILLSASASAQESSKAPVVSSHARLMAARSIFIEHTGARLPNDVIGDAFQGWGHYVVVNDPEQADLIVSIDAPASDPGVSVGGGNGRRGSTSANSRTSSSSGGQIRLLILDGHDRVVLWSGSEQPKSSIKERSREDFVVDASLRLFRRFRDTIEPEPAP